MVDYDGLVIVRVMVWEWNFVWMECDEKREVAEVEAAMDGAFCAAAAGTMDDFVKSLCCFLLWKVDLLRFVGSLKVLMDGTYGFKIFWWQVDMDMRQEYLTCQFY